MTAYSLDGVLASAEPKRSRLSILVLVALGLLLGGALHATTMHAPADTDEAIALCGP